MIRTGTIPNIYYDDGSKKHLAISYVAETDFDTHANRKSIKMRLRFPRILLAEKYRMHRISLSGGGSVSERRYFNSIGSKIEYTKTHSNHKAGNKRDADRDFPLPRWLG